MSTPFIWTQDLPTCVGRYWHRENPNHEEDIVKVYRDQGETELSVRHGPRPSDTVFLLNWAGHEWAGPIPVPREPCGGTQPPSDIYTPPVRLKRRRPRA